MSAPYTSKSVANTLLCIAEKNHIVDICLRKLQKLIYFSNAWHLVYFDIPLIKEEVEAWEFGPVIHDIHFEFKEFGLTSIKRLAKELVYTDGELKLIAPTIPAEDEDVHKLLDKVFQRYGRLSASQLLNLVHLEGEPWRIVADQYNEELSHRIEIPRELIKCCFDKQLQA